MIREFDIKLRTTDSDVTPEQIEYQIELYCSTEVKVVDIKEVEV